MGARDDAVAARRRARGGPGGARGAADGARPRAWRAPEPPPSIARARARRRRRRARRRPRRADVGFARRGHGRRARRARRSATRRVEARPGLPARADAPAADRDRRGRGRERPGRRRLAPARRRVTEIVGVATLPAVRRQGLGGAVTGALVEDALAPAPRSSSCRPAATTIARVYAPARLPPGRHGLHRRVSEQPVARGRARRAGDRVLGDPRRPRRRLPRHRRDLALRVRAAACSGALALVGAPPLRAAHARASAGSRSPRACSSRSTSSSGTTRSTTSARAWRPCSATCRSSIVPVPRAGRARRARAAQHPARAAGRLRSASCSSPARSSTGAYGANPARGALLGIATGLAYAAFLLVQRQGSMDLRRPGGRAVRHVAGGRGRSRWRSGW